MLNKEDFICRTCKGSGVIEETAEHVHVRHRDNPDYLTETECSTCEGYGYMRSEIDNLIHSEGLDSVLADLEIIRAMKEGESDVTLNFSNAKEDRTLIWCKDEQQWEIISEQTVKLSGMFDSPLAAVIQFMGGKK